MSRRSSTTDERRRLTRDEEQEIAEAEVGAEMPEGGLARAEAAILEQMREHADEAASLDQLIHTPHGLDVLAELSEGSKARAGTRFKVAFQDVDGNRYYVGPGPWETGQTVPNESFLAGLLARGRIREGHYIVTVRKRGVVLSTVHLYLHPPLADPFQAARAHAGGGEESPAFGLLRTVLTAGGSPLGLPAGRSEIERLRERVEDLEEEDRAKTSDLEALGRRVAELEAFAQQALGLLQQAQQGEGGAAWAPLIEKAIEAFAQRPTAAAEEERRVVDTPPGRLNR